ncbi:hypothetical protein HDV05_003309 [Chytridiales sp. JEL 0842]|nr:hypothetical protein HDV05_003309 [Chytridiales sp. JEL 0842]
MPTLAAVRSANAMTKITGTRSLVVGGTSGIGEAIARRLALAGSNVTIVGRNKVAADTIIQSINENGGTASFTALDTSLIKNVKEFGEQFCKQESRLDYLVISAGIMKVQGRVETSEGLDEKMSTHYYARHAMISALMPLLEKTAAEPNTDVRVLTVLAARMGSPVPKEDLDLKKTFTMKLCHDATTFHSDLMVESFHKLHPSVSFIHAYPGVVNTNLGRNLPFYFRGPLKLMMSFVMSPADCGEFMTYSLLDSKFKKGWYLVNEKGERFLGINESVTPKYDRPYDPSLRTPIEPLKPVASEIWTNQRAPQKREELPPADSDALFAHPFYTPQAKPQTGLGPLIEPLHWPEFDQSRPTTQSTPGLNSPPAIKVADWDHPTDSPIGDYPRMPIQYTALKDPFGYWDQQGRRNYGEVVHEHHNLLDEWSIGPEVSGWVHFKATMQVFAFIGLMGFGVAVWDPEKNLWAAEKDFPYDGLRVELGADPNDPNDTWVQARQFKHQFDPTAKFL